MDILFWTGGFIVVAIVLAVAVYRAAIKQVDKTGGDQD